MFDVLPIHSISRAGSAYEDFGCCDLVQSWRSLSNSCVKWYVAFLYCYRDIYNTSECLGHATRYHNVRQILTLPSQSGLSFSQLPQHCNCCIRWPQFISCTINQILTFHHSMRVVDTARVCFTIYNCTTNYCLTLVEMKPGFVHTHRRTVLQLM